MVTREVQPRRPRWLRARAVTVHAVSFGVLVGTVGFCSGSCAQLLGADEEPLFKDGGATPEDAAMTTRAQDAAIDSPFIGAPLESVDAQAAPPVPDGGSPPFNGGAEVPDSGTSAPWCAGHHPCWGFEEEPLTKDWTELYTSEGDGRRVATASYDGTGFGFLSTITAARPFAFLYQTLARPAQTSLTRLGFEVRRGSCRTTGLTRVAHLEFFLPNGSSSLIADIRYNSDGKYYFFACTSSSCNPSYTTATVVDGGWHHLELVYQKTSTTDGVVTFKFDGLPASVGPFVNLIVDSFVRVSVGQAAYTQGNPETCEFAYDNVVMDLTP